MGDHPSVSVAICTRNRPADLARCLESIRSLNVPPDEVLVIDQSDVEGPIDTGRFRIHRMSEHGLSRARNEAITLASSDIIAFLDDDCTVPPDWTEALTGAFERHPDASLIFGQVRRATEDFDEYVPEHVFSRELRLKGRFSSISARGIGAAMYLRASAVKDIGLFDVQLGAGSRFMSSEDWDYVARALAAGSTVVEVPSIVVNHHGGRRYSTGDAARLLRSNAYSHGAVHAKLLRCGEPAAVALVLNEIWCGLVLLRPYNVLLGKPTHAARLLSYVKGLAAGARLPVDRPSRVYA